MESIVLKNIPLRMDVESHANLLRIKKGDAYDDFARLVDEARRIANPKALFKQVFIESRGDDFIVAEGVTFKSRVLAVNIEKVHKVFPFIITCGAELDDWSRAMDDQLHRFWAEAIMGMALISAIAGLENHLRDNYGIEKIAHMSPGSLEDWPIEEQVPLFKLLGDVEKSVGVKLTESYLMTPTKTVSGIRFASEVNFESCMLCPREECPGRRAKYDKDLYEKRYKKKNA